MKLFYRENEKKLLCPLVNQRMSFTPTEFPNPSLLEDIRKTRIALEDAYAGFDNAVDDDMIDCYIFEINSLYKRYRHLSRLAEAEMTARRLPVNQQKILFSQKVVFPIPAPIRIFFRQVLHQ